jgi:dolichol-phosphate mannosyltransferase
MTEEARLISIIIPMYNEEEVARKTYGRLTGVMEGIKLPYELLFIDDSSADGTFNILKELSRTDPRVKVVRFSRNFGTQAALTAGLDHASGDAVITIDGDLQHPPELIPELIEKWQAGYEVVYTVREYGKSTSAFKKATSAIFYKLMSKFARIDMPTGATDFKLYDKKVVERLKSLKERNRFLRGLSIWVGFKQTAVGFEAAKRAAGTSKYSTRRLIGLALDGITSFSIFPLKLSIYLGFAVSFLSFAYLCYVLYAKLIADRAVAGWASTTAAVLFIGGVQLIAIGILGEYIGRIYEEVKGRPTYIVTTKVGFEEDDDRG